VGAGPGDRFDEDVPAGGIGPVALVDADAAGHLKRREEISVSWHYIARIRREENLKPHRSGTFKMRIPYGPGSAAGQVRSAGASRG
jgi:hypothetical protein